MAISLYDISIGSYLQMLGALSNVLQKGRNHCEANGIDLNEVVAMRLHPDMNPFRFQIHAVTHLSLGAWKGLQEGRFSPPPPVPDLDYAGFQQRVADTHTELGKVSREVKMPLVTIGNHSYSHAYNHYQHFYSDCAS